MHLAAKLWLLRLPVLLAIIGAAGFVVGSWASRADRADHANLADPVAAAPQDFDEPARAPRVVIDPDVPPDLVELPDREPDDLARLLVPGCSLEQYQARKRELGELSDALYRSPGASSASAFDELRRLLALPCLDHVTAMSPLPADASRVSSLALQDFTHHLERAMILRADAKGLLAYLPPELELELDKEALAELERWRCRDDDPACARTNAYLSRAYQSAGVRSQIYEERYKDRILDPVYDYGADGLAVSLCDEGATTMSLATWAACAARRAPRQLVHTDPFPPFDARYRAPVRGWLMIHRGDGKFDDALEVYDLATGSLYSAKRVAESCTPPHPVTVMTGQISVDAARELAFLLATKPALHTLRLRPYLARIPLGVALTHSPAQPPPPQSRTPRPPGRTYTFHYFDGPLHAEGTFSSTDHLIGPHLASLAQILERGAIETCATATLPSRAERDFRHLPTGTSGIIDHRLSAEGWRARQLEGGVEAALEDLRLTPCVERHALLEQH